MYGGPAPQFFASPVVEYLLDGTVHSVCIEGVPDQSIQRSLFQVLQYECMHCIIKYLTKAEDSPREWHRPFFVCDI